MNTLLNITIKCFLLCLCLPVCEAYGQKAQTLKREPLTNGDTAVWVRDSLGRIGIYFQKEHERYVDLFHYRDTAKTGVSRNSVGKRFHATPLICCDRFEIHRNKGLSLRRQNSSAL